MQNAAASNILQRNDNQLNNDLAQYAQNYRASTMMTFDKFGNSGDILVLNKFTGFDVIDMKIKYFGIYEEGLSETKVIHVILCPKRIGSIETLKRYEQVYIDIDPETYFRTVICIGLLKEDVEYIKFLIGEELFNTLINN